MTDWCDKVCKIRKYCQLVIQNKTDTKPFVAEYTLYEDDCENLVNYYEFRRNKSKSIKENYVVDCNYTLNRYV